MPTDLLSKESARLFLAKFWQKTPWLLRQAIHRAPQIDRDDLIALACRDDVEARLVVGARKSWDVRYGPFRKRDFRELPERNWTLLVNGLENFVPAARALQTRFSFLPYARHDDVMVSYAAPGGSVGPHFDSYDVFLLQGMGCRQWQISAQRDLTLIADLPLKILRHFRAQQQWRLRDGDLLYLPPRYAHYGVALEPCITWSIGVRMPSPQEFATRFLNFLQDHLKLTDRKKRQELRLPSHPAKLDAMLLKSALASVAALRWSKTDIAHCLGEYLSEPPANVIFERPPPMAKRQFSRLLAQRGVRLNLKSRMLWNGSSMFINGETVVVSKAERGILQNLADHRCLPSGLKLSPAGTTLLYGWFTAGYIEIVSTING